MGTSTKSLEHIGPSQLDLVKAILLRRIPGARVWVFGSRSSGVGVRSASDLDLAVDAGQKMNIALLAELREDFKESDLPFSVDVADLHAMDPAFRKLVEPDFLPLEDAR